MTDRQLREHDTPGAARPPVGQPDEEDRGVRVLPPHVMREVLEAVGTAVGTGVESKRPPKLVRPERLEHLVDVAPSVRAGQVVVLQVDQLSERDQLRALDVATGIAVALDARMKKLDATPGVSIVPRALAGVRTPRLEHPDATEPVEPPAPVAQRPQPALCALCELRQSDSRFDPPIDLVIARDGSRCWAPQVATCERCRHTVRNWRFAVAWCSECERWGRRGVESPCKRVYGA